MPWQVVGKGPWSRLRQQFVGSQLPVGCHEQEESSSCPKAWVLPVLVPREVAKPPDLARAGCALARSAVHQRSGVRIRCLQLARFPRGKNVTVRVKRTGHRRGHPWTHTWVPKFNFCEQFSSADMNEVLHQLPGLSPCPTSLLL